MKTKVNTAREFYYRKINPATWLDIEKKFINECCVEFEERYSLDKEKTYNIKSDNPYEMLAWWKSVVGDNFR